MPLSTKKIADSIELINNALDNIRVKNKKDFIPIWEGLQNILEIGSGKTPENKIIQEHLSDIADILNEPTLGYTEPENFPEFQNIIRQRIASKMQEFQSMTRSVQARYMRKQKQKIAKVKYAKLKLSKIANDSKWITKQQRHNTGAPETYEEMLARTQRDFQRNIPILPLFENQADQPQEIRNRRGEIIINSRELDSLNIETRNQFCQNVSAINVLITEAHISFNQLSIIGTITLTEFIQNADAIKSLCTYAHITANQLIAMNPAIRTELILHCYSFIGLNITKNFSIEELTSLNAQQAHILLSNPDSPESRSILFDIEASRSRFRFCSIS